LTEADREAIMAADLVCTGRRRTDDADVYVVAEVSEGVGPHDVERAAARARLLARLGQPAIPVVAGRWINSEAAALAQTSGVWQVVDGHADPPD
jgi:hypothetical protein